MATKKRRTPPDWEAIEREYRAGSLSVRELAAMHDVPEATIRHRAKMQEWSRDLSKQVRAQVQGGLLRAELRTSEGRAMGDREAVDTAAARGIEVVLGHRKRIARQQEMLDRLDVQVGRMLGHAEQLHVESEGYPAHIGRAVSHLDKMAGTLVRLIGAERQAFNLDAPVDAAPSESTPDDVVRRMAAEVLDCQLPPTSPG